MQKLDIRDIKHNLGAHMTLSQQEPLLVDGVNLVGPVDLDLKLTNAGTRILLEGEIRYVVSIECDRCARPFECRQVVDLHEEFYRPGSEELPKGPDLHPEELNLFVYSDDRLDVAEVIRQNVIAGLPIQILCREDCAGLCTHCGADRNEAPCTCSETRIDPRWEGLKKFIKTDV